MLGGSAATGGYFSKNSDQFVLSFAPNIGIFIADNLSVGAAISSGISLGDGWRSSSFGIQPFGRYYFVRAGDIGLFGMAKLGLVGSSSNYNNSSTSRLGFDGDLGGGFVYFLNNSIGIEATMNFNMVKYEDRDPNFDLMLRIGFQIHFDRGN